MTLDHSRVSSNTAVAGGGIFNVDTVNLLASLVFGNIPDNCVGC
jgi:hypothetical protein